MASQGSSRSASKLMTNAKPRTTKPRTGEHRNVARIHDSFRLVPAVVDAKIRARRRMTALRPYAAHYGKSSTGDAGGGRCGTDTPRRSGIGLARLGSATLGCPANIVDGSWRTRSEGARAPARRRCRGAAPPWLAGVDRIRRAMRAATGTAAIEQASRALLGLRQRRDRPRMPTRDSRPPVDVWRIARRRTSAAGFAEKRAFDPKGRLNGGARPGYEVPGPFDAVHPPDSGADRHVGVHLQGFCLADLRHTSVGRGDGIARGRILPG